MQSFFIIIALLALAIIAVLTFGAWIMTWGWLPTAIVILVIVGAILFLREVS